ncbi:MAG TPA: right-handed parallel beta-helix repeat-containing protein [Chitinophagaceae bacterium]|jgi:parallel beta-helix repeat protein|nr:right-handed parallel beta-helix repeat-containing protein [Chitinophagaceae bacterium]
MKSIQGIILIFIVIMGFVLTTPLQSLAQPFVHPGINQQLKDLAYMKKLVKSGAQPWKDAFDKLKIATDTAFTIKPYVHVLRGPYGKPNIGGDDLSRSANMAYNYALLWYITNDKSYADKAIEILNAWSRVLHDFDYNDAKLLAAWTGHVFCNAAEILRYTNVWKQKDIDAFSNMLMTVYYPLMRYYYPQANGNWDGAIIHSILAIAIFTDNRKMFNNAIDHFLHSPVNGSIFKYIYPSGQCQESTRDQGHVQLGLGEFAGAAQVAFTQGVDLFSIGNNRIALGYEYTARFVLGEQLHSYGIISERARTIRDDYEYVYRHYSAIGVNMPYTKRAADSIRSTASRSVLTSVRVDYGKKQNGVSPKPSSIGYIAGAGFAVANNFPANTVMVEPGQSLQKALDDVSVSGGWVIAKSGIHTLSSSLKIPANVILCGEGLKTILFLDPASSNRETIVNASNDLHDITIRDLVIECALKTEPPSDPNSARSYRGGYNRGGILFRSDSESGMKNIKLINLTVQNATYQGVSISETSGITINHCDFNENGASVPPGQKLLHNLFLSHCSNAQITDSRFVTSPYGGGIVLEQVSDVSISNCEIARNGYYGILITECKNILIKNNLIEANDRSGIMAEYLRQGSQNLSITGNLIQFNNGFGVESYAVTNGKYEKNIYTGNGNNMKQEKINIEKNVLME